jgi:long-chain acyl-CoA synthetase
MLAFSAMASPERFETLVDIFTRSIDRFPSRELFGTKTGGAWRFSTYAEFGQDVDGLRGGLASLGVGKGDKVAIIANNRVEWAVSAYATYTLGAAFVPMYEAQLEKDWEYIVADSEAKVLIVATRAILERTRPFLGFLPKLEHLVLLENDDTANGEKTSTYEKLKGSGNRAPVEHPLPSDVAGFIYTSGTTGEPKGVILSHANIASNVDAVKEILPVQSSDRSLSFLPWAHSFGQTCELNVFFSRGASMGICEGVDKIIDNLSEIRPTLLISVPRIFNKIYSAVERQIASKPLLVQKLVRNALLAKAKERGGATLGLSDRAVVALADKLVFSKVRARFGGNLRFAISGGAALSTEVGEFIESLGITVYEGYGLSETSPIVTTNYPGHRKIGSVGPAVPGVEVVIDGAGQKDGPREGEVIVFGPNVMVGYHNRSEESAAVFVDRASLPAAGAPPPGSPPGSARGFRTGDMGYLDADGFLYITGRIKEQYKLENGKYVVPTPLEEELKLSPYIANAMAYGDNRPYNVALIVPNIEALKSWAEKNGLATAKLEELFEHAKVRDLFEKEIAKLSKKFKGYEAVRAFALVADDFTTANGMLTPKLSLKRRKVLEAYGGLIEGIYAKQAARSKTETGSAASAA